LTRDELKKELFNRGIDSRYFFTPLHSQPCYKDLINDSKDFKVSIEISQKGMYLPSGLDLSEEQIYFICNNIKLLNEK